MSSPLLKLGAFGLGLAVVFTAALGLGRAVGPEPAPAAPVAATHAQHAPADGPAPAAAEVVGGLQITQDGYRLAPLSATLSTGRAQPFRFRILGPDHQPVTAYTTSHTKDLHLIVVRRDLTGFQHVHPSLSPDGTWSVPLAVAAPGQYRVFADFKPAARADGLTLGADVPAPGDYRPRTLPPAVRTATVDGYTVSLAGDLSPGGASKLTLTVRKGGAPVTDLQPYLGAYGHLVALRDGDLAYLHVHPDDSGGKAGPDIAFHAEVPAAGAYRLYLDFQHGGKVRTAEFTAIAGPAVAVPTLSTGHDADGHTHD